MSLSSRSFQSEVSKQQLQCLGLCEIRFNIGALKDSFSVSYDQALLRVLSLRSFESKLTTTVLYCIVAQMVQKSCFLGDIFFKIFINRGGDLTNVRKIEKDSDLRMIDQGHLKIWTPA